MCTQLKPLLISAFLIVVTALQGFSYAVTLKVHNVSDGSVFFEVYYSPASEDIGALDVHIQLKATANVVDVIASSSQTGAWSQISPSVTRSSNIISIAAAAPTIFLSSDTSQVLMYTAMLKFSGTNTNFNTINDFADSIWIEKAFSTTGSTLNDIGIHYTGLTAIRKETIDPATANAATITNVGRRYTLSFNLAIRSFITAHVVDAAGKIVQEISKDYFPAGIHTLSWDGRDKNNRQLPSGTYFLELSTGSTTYNKKITYVR
jgi:hypothetical protein